MIAREILTPELLEELAPLIRANHDATEIRARLEPDWSIFDHLERGGALCLIVARDGTRPVGYVAHMMINHPSYGERWAQCVAIYVLPSHRRLARSLMAKAEEMAKGAGAAVVTYSIPINPRAHRSLVFVGKLGYQPTETVCTKRL